MPTAADYPPFNFPELASVDQLSEWLADHPWHSDADPVADFMRVRDALHEARGRRADEPTRAHVGRVRALAQEFESAGPAALAAYQQTRAVWLEAQERRAVVRAMWYTPPPEKKSDQQSEAQKAPVGKW